ncbi:MAG TPA: nickel transporter [Novimethylophilus sp.]|jgi:high-affinity nickel-transport protein|uniref:HoxN/HupN/NixA family nickel/cobalt transporter n=1 Tax=Novimethylophilus sp. TaxID=2137426 RepID=UPI002F3F4B17
MDNTLYPLIVLAFVLGAKHGLDADHLATIDGMTRFNAAAGRLRLARLCGLLFSLGHGAVVCVAAVAAGLLFSQAAVPGWMDAVGAWVSAFFLLLLGALNLHAVFSTPHHEVVRLVGVKGRWLGRLKCAGHPAMVALVGALFALSFDTLSQAALFSASAAHRGGMVYALLPAMFFMLGMMATDAANGWWISHLLKRADATARAASRIMGLTVAVLSLAVAGLGLSRRYLLEAAAWQEGRELALGAAVICIVASAFLLARYWPRRAAAIA